MISFRNIVLWLLVAIIILDIIFVGLISWKNRCLEKQTIDTFVTIKDIGERKMIGLNTNQDQLNFGAMSPGILGKRTISLVHSTNAEVTITLTGKIASWISMTPLSPISLNARTPQEINFEVKVPNSALAGNYLGKAIFCFREM